MGRFSVIVFLAMELRHDALMALSDTANWYGVEMDCKSAHRALYDAEITTELIRGVLIWRIQRGGEKYSPVL